MNCRLVLIVFMLGTFSGCNEKKSTPEDRNNTVNREEMISAAKLVFSLQGPGYKILESTTFYDVNNIEWNKLFLKMQAENSSIVMSLKAKLKNRDYQSIRFTSNELSTAGQFWVFLDKHTGEVITWCGGL